MAPARQRRLRFECKAEWSSSLLTRTACTYALGTAAVMGWAPLQLYGIALAAFAILWLLLQHGSFKGSLWLSLLFSLGLHITGNGWVLSALTSKTGMSDTAAYLGTAVYIAYLCLFSVIPLAVMSGYLRTVRLSASKRMVYAALLFPALLTIGEWLRSFPFNGFTSLSLGYSLIDTPLAGYATVGGVFLVSWAGYTCAVLLAMLALTCVTWLKCAEKRKGTIITITIAALAALLAALITLGGLLLNIAWTTPYGPPLTYRLIQSNTPQWQKSDPEYITAHMRDLSSIAQQEPADIIVMPETSFPVLYSGIPSSLITELTQFASATHSNLFIGTYTAAASGGRYNSLVQISPASNARPPAYNKSRLMPFGEYSPTGFAYFTSQMTIPHKHLVAGAVSQAPFIIQGKQVAAGTLICHEDFVSSGATKWASTSQLLINPSNLGWFEGTLAIPQHLQIARMRALESGRPILRVTNTGISAAIDQRGRLLNVSKENTNVVLEGSIQPMTGLTPYDRYGERLLMGLSLIIAVCTACLRLRSRAAI